ncbi:integrase, catalytic region, zinc finger, CCHC-type containing protein [Tanacetum coccineum]
MVKSWLVQDQTVLGKDYSNLLIADSLLKTIWFINSPCYGNEALASPKANVNIDGVLSFKSLVKGLKGPKSWLWHRRLSHLNFGAINHFARHGQKDEAPDFIIKFLKMIQVRLKVPVRRLRIDNGTEFVNQTLCEYYEKVGISHETSVARSLHQNGVVERRNRTLIEAARTMLIYAKAPLFLWAEAVATNVTRKSFPSLPSSSWKKHFRSLY